MASQAIGLMNEAIERQYKTMINASLIRKAFELSTAMKKNLPLYCAGLLSLAPLPATAQGIDISVGLPYVIFDEAQSRGEINVDDKVGDYQLGLGYRFDNPFGVELRFLDSHSNIEGTDDQADMFDLSVDGHYYFLEDDEIHPYLAAGVGHLRYDFPGNDSEETSVNAGLGIKVKMVENLSLRMDYRLIRTLDYESNHNVVTLGLNYAFGGFPYNRPKAKPVAPAPAPIVAPVVETPVDSDNDSVFDRDDVCPGTPAGISVDLQGCPLDGDSDGVSDGVDQCPNSIAGAKVNEVGCAKELLKDINMRVEINFDNNSSVVKQQYFSEIEKVANTIRNYENVQVEIAGYTDSAGAESYNQSLSERRANAVADVLVNRTGITRSIVSATGYGEANPVATNATREGRAQNRRVVARIRARDVQ